MSFFKGSHTQSASNLNRNNNNFFNSNSTNQPNLFSNNSMNQTQTNFSSNFNNQPTVLPTSNMMMNMKGLDPDTQQKLAPIVNSFVSGLMISMNNTSAGNSHSKGVYDNQAVDNLFKSFNKEKSFEQISNTGRYSNNTEETKIKELIAKMEKNDKESERMNNQNFFHSKFTDQNYLQVKNHFTKNYGKTAKNKNPVRNKRKNTRGSYSFYKRGNSRSQNQQPNISILSKDLSITKVNLVVNYSNHSINKNDISLNLNSTVGLFIDWVLRTINLFGESFEKVQKSANLFVGSLDCKREIKLSEIANLDKNPIFLDINVVYPDVPESKKNRIIFEIYIDQTYITIKSLY